MARWLATAPSSGDCANSRQAWATASRWALKFPLSTVDTYIGSIGAHILGVVPVQEVAAMALELLQGVQRGFEPLQQGLRANPAKLAGAGSAEQVHADVGG